MSSSPAQTDDSALRGEVSAESPSAGDASALLPPAPRTEIVDVWSRTEPKYRIRAIVMLIANFLLFCGLCVFTYWLNRVRMFDFSLESYLAPARFWVQSPNLTDFILYPINVTRLPEHAAVLGLLIASMVAVPILIAILYRFPFSLPFIAAVLVFAHLPWMTLTLLASCVLASVRPFRMKFRFGSALVGLLPVVLYLYLSTGGNALLDEASPTQRLLLMAPWVLAIIAAATMCGVVLLASWIVNYRPGVVAPVVAVMFATPVILFHARVGMDELKYRALEQRCGPRSPLFQPVQDLEPELRELVARFANDPEYTERYWGDVLSALGGKPGAINRAVWHSLLVELMADRAEAFEETKRFIADHPMSRYAPNALFLQARILDTRLVMNEAVLPRTRELYADFPHVQSESPWLAILNGHARSPLAVAAGYRVAQLQLRRGQIDAALQSLVRVAEIAAAIQLAVATTQPARTDDYLKQLPPEASLDFQPLPYVVDARRLADLIRSNRDDAEFENLPLTQLACLDPRRPEYLRELGRLEVRFRDAKLGDNLRVRMAMAESDLAARAEQLTQLVGSLRVGDALPEAMFHLADLELQRSGENAREHRERGVARLREIVERFPESAWADDARERLARLGDAKMMS
ncbi:MAG: tetratricopeptide repeat protein [Phycisphaerae bacterium]